LYLQPNAGVSQYFGDLNKEDYYNQNPEFAFGAVLGYQLSPVFGLRGQFMKTNLYSERAEQNRLLNSNLWDIALHFTVNINEIFAKYNEKRFFNFYLFSGGGLSVFKSTLENIIPSEVIIQHTDWQTEFFVPIGAGASFRLSHSMALNLEYGDHMTFKSNALDFSEGIKKNDHYSYASIGLQIKLAAKDTDNDGVKDKEDICPHIPGKAKLAGCPDMDNDGVADKDDACPDIAGNPEFQGCPDSDGDGTIDTEDGCPFAAGKKELRGCPDMDNDSIADKFDKCPDVPGKKGLGGCPDRDNDGIADKDDFCPDIKGLAAFAGCPDRDGDGVPDNQDSCIYEAGKKELNGCPDKDNDSIADKFDKCPDVPGKKELAGCPDRDGDGIADKDDLCPDKRGILKFKGCPDTDGDGIPDNKDYCPTVAGVVANNGCPGKKGTATVLQKTVYFGPGSSELLPTFGNTMSLDDVIAFMNENTEAVITITGYEDAVEAIKSSTRLSEKRADYVINYLKQKGMKSVKIKKLPGKSKSSANDNTAEGRAFNRRVEIKITK
jgi:outer membrane protein OmpA-like peptidoglycan-associated protein